jgi:signal transduction histidine kinase
VTAGRLSAGGGAGAAAALPTLAAMNRSGIDWTQLWYPGPRHAFTADEMSRAGSDAPSPTLIAVAAVNFASIALVVLQFAPAAETARLTGMLVVLAVMGSTAARWLWWRPWRRPLMQASFAIVVAMLLLAFGIRWRLPDVSQRYASGMTLAVGSAVLVIVMWFLVVWRAHEIQARLREMAERERAIEMARRLSAAQLAPHFLFNTLASVQHWVHTRDERAGPMLDSLVGYLRATLPLFNRPLHPLGDELEAVRRYLEVMHSRLGARLRFEIDAPAALVGLPLPPGLVLTLAENAIEHGIEPQLVGGSLVLRAQRLGDQVSIEVIDDGPGPAGPEGLGLANCRERLALTYGTQAALTVQARPEGGCVAKVRLPWSAA